jgi:hypothetical protein
MYVWSMLGRLRALLSQLLRDSVGFVLEGVISYRGLIALQITAACIIWVWAMENVSALALS